MALTGAQVKQLRSMAHHLNPAIIIGKSDVNEGKKGIGFGDRLSA